MNMPITPKSAAFEALDALLAGPVLSSGQAETAATKVINIPLSLVVPDPNQPRSISAPIEEKAQELQISELAASIADHGQIAPITVTDLGGQYQIVCGERRFKAARALGQSTIQAIVIGPINAGERLLMQLVENMQRKALADLDVGKAVVRLRDEHHISQGQIACSLGTQPSHLSRCVAMVDHPLVLEGLVESASVLARLKSLSEPERTKIVEVARATSCKIDHSALATKPKSSRPRPSAPGAPATMSKTGDKEPSARIHSTESIDAFFDNLLPEDPTFEIDFDQLIALRHLMQSASLDPGRLSISVSLSMAALSRLTSADLTHHTEEEAVDALRRILIDEARSRPSSQINVRFASHITT